MQKTCFEVRTYGSWNFALQRYSPIRSFRAALNKKTHTFIRGVSNARLRLGWHGKLLPPKDRTGQPRVTVFRRLAHLAMLY